MDAGGLTPVQVGLVVSSWKYVEADYQGFGLHLLLKYFGKYPEYQELFPDFKGQSLDDLRNSVHTRAHATTIMYNLSSMLNQFDDMPCVERMIKKQGFNHYHHGARMVHYHKFTPVFIETLSEKLGDKFTPEIEEAWTEMFKMFMYLTEEGMKKASS